MTERANWCGAARCPGEFTQQPEKSKDGKRTWANVCLAGINGGCRGPEKTQIEELDAVAGKIYSTPKRRKRPVIYVSDEFGLVAAGRVVDRELLAVSAKVSDRTEGEDLTYYDTFDERKEEIF